MVRVDVWLPDPAGALATGAFGAGALIRIERADVDGLGVLGAYAEVHTLAIVATALQYQWWDAAGLATSSYRWRISNAGGTTLSPYSDPFAGTNPAGALVPPRTYATLDQVLALFETAPSISRQRRLAALLGTVTDEIIGEFDGRDYFQHPATGTETWYADGRGDRVLHLHDGLISLTTLEISLDLGQTFSVVPNTEYWLFGDNPQSAESIPAGEPYFHVILRPFGTFYVFPSGPRLVRLTGVRGWPAIPTALSEGCAERVRQIAFADPSYQGSIPGDDDYGRPVVTARWPQVLYNFLQSERERFWCHV